MNRISDHPRQPVAALCKRHAQYPQGKEPEAPSTWRGRLARSLILLTTLTLPATAQLDTSGNGMSDVWERHFNNGNLFDPENPAHHPNADPDGDGWTNLEESIAGTDPFSGNPPEGMVAIHVTHLPDQPAAEGGTADVAIISWDTLPGKIYTLFVSPDLTAESWFAVDTPYSGDGTPAAISTTLTDSEGVAPDKLFWRVHVHDPHTDSDNDGLTDYEEYLLGSSPNNADTSGDGVSDGWLVVHGYNPNDNHENILFGDSDLSVPDAYNLGVQDHPDATLDDFDGDGVPNYLDADPKDHQIDWERADVSDYVLIDLGWPSVSGSSLGNITDFNENGHVLHTDSVWINGNWHPLQYQNLSGTAYRFDYEYTYQSQNTPSGKNQGYRLTPSGGMIQRGFWDAYGGPGDVFDQEHVGFMPYDADTSNHGNYVSTLSTLGPFINNKIASIGPCGGDATGRIFVINTLFQAHSEVLILNENLLQTGSLNLSDDLYPRWRYSRVTRSGWVAASASATSQSEIDQTLIWDPDGKSVGSINGHLPFYFQDLAELPNGNVALTYFQAFVGDQVFLFDPIAGSFRGSPTLSGKKIRAFAGNGTAITTDHKFWLNGELVPIADLCPAYRALRDDGWSLSPFLGNKHGTFLIRGSKGNEAMVALLMPIDYSIFPPEPTEDELTAAGYDNWEVETFQIPADDPEFWIQANVMVPGVDEDGENAWVPAVDGTVITWEIVSDESDSGAVLSDETTETENGHTAVKLTTSTEPGARIKVRGLITTLKLPVENSQDPTVHENTDGFIEVKTQLFEVVPGNVTYITLTAGASTMPADEASEIEIEAVFTDAAGNPAARGTDVNWRVSGGGQIQDRDHLIAEQDGVATATLVSGSIVGTQTVTVEADGVVSEIQINNTPVQIVSLTPSVSSLDIATGQSTTITLQTSGIADGAPVSWSTTKGTILSYEGVVENNSAQAVLVADAGIIGDAGVIATVGNAVAHCEVVFTSSAAASIEVSQPVIVHDELSDGSSPVPTLSGNPENIPYFAESLITIRAPGHPGAWATIDFNGSSGTYGLQHSFDAATDNLSPSSIEGYPATLAGNAEIDETWHLVREGTGSLSLPEATSTATIPHHDSLSLADGSTMRFAIYPVETVGQVIAKVGEYQIAFLPDGRLEFTLGAGLNVTSVASAMPLVPENWSDVTLSIQSGHLWMNVGGATTATPLLASLPVSTSNLVIGGMIGHFDALRYTHAQSGFQGISISASGLNGLNQVQLDANGEATITVTAQALGGGPPEGSIGQNVDVEITLASQSVVAKNAITVTDKGTAVLIRAIAGQSAVIGTDTSNLDRAEMAHNFLRRGIRDADRVGALPADMGGDAAARGECGYLIAIWMEETVDDAGIVHPLMHVSAQNLPEEVAEVLNWMLAEMMVSAGHRPDSESFKDYILRNHKELLMALQALSAGDEDAFLAIASIADGEEAFGDLSVAGNQVGDGFMTRIAKTAASEINNGYELVRAAFNRRNSRIKMASLSQGGANFNHAIRGPIIDLMQAGDAGMEAVLRDLSQALYTAEILTSQEVAAVGALYGFLREGNEIAQEIAHPELFAKAIPTLLDMLIGAARGDEASLDALKDIGSAIVMGPINEIPQASDAWDSGQHFNAGSHYAAAAVGGVLIADTFKRSLQRGAYRSVAHGKHLRGMAGKRGEALAMARFRAKGYTDVVPIQNRSGHGIDLIMRDKDGGIVAVEVKSHLLMQRPDVKTDMRQFVLSRLQNASSPNPNKYWKNVDPKTRASAIRYLDDIQIRKRPVKGIVVNIDYALCQYPRERYYIWAKGLGAEIFINQF